MSHQGIRTIVVALTMLGLTACAAMGTNEQEPIEQISQSNEPESFVPRFVWPVDGGEITDSYGKRRRRGRVHKGLDIAGRKNTPIYAAEAGKVVWRGRGRGYGHYVVIRHDNGWSTRYAHLNRYRVKWSQRVKKGDLIGHMGRTGRASGTHLHFEIRKNKETLNPLALLPKQQIKLADQHTGIPSSPDRQVASAKETFRSAYLNGPVVWLF